MKLAGDPKAIKQGLSPVFYKNNHKKVSTLQKKYLMLLNNKRALGHYPNSISQTYSNITTIYIK